MKTKLEVKEEKYRILIMVILITICCFLTYYFHTVLKSGTVFTHFFYIPIILASIWWKRKGLAAAIFLAAYLIISHFYLRVSIETINDLIRAPMFIVVSLVTAFLSESIFKVQEELKKHREHLEELVEERTVEIRMINEQLQEEVTERKQAEQHIKHLNSVLKAIRNVNQLIVTEKDGNLLLRKACDVLVDARGYEGVWVALLKDDDIIVKVESSGFGKDVPLFREKVMGVDLPSCIRNAMARKEIVMLVDRSEECGDCFLKDAHADNEVAIIRIEHDGRIFGLLTVSFSPDVAVDEEEKELLRGVAYDISFALHDMEMEEARRRAEMETRLLQKLTMAISEAPDFETALDTALSLTCEHTGWVMGEAWVPNHDETTLEYCLGYCDDSGEYNERLRHFIELSKQFTFPQGVGLPGRVWQSKHPEWRHDISGLSEEIYLRAKPSKEAGLKAALGVPIISNGQVLIVLVFYMITPQPEDERQIKLVSAVATQLGTVILRRRAEEELCKSEALLIETGRMAKVGGWELDAETLEVRWTEETYRIHEVPLDYKLPLDEAINFYHPEDRPKLEHNIQRALEHGTPYDIKLRFITAKGKHLWTHSICTPHIVDGKTVKLTGTFQDITERKQAEEELQERLQELEIYYKATMGREGRIIELKQQVNELLVQLGKEKKFDV